MTTTTFEIGIRGNDIARSRTVRHTGTLAGAKRKATAEFGSGFAHHTIVIYDLADDRGPVATRTISSGRWDDAR